MYVDPEKARQERDRQERDRQAKLKAERDRQARIKAEQERQAKLKAERDRKARLKAEQERQSKLKADQKDSDKKPTEAKKATEPKPDPTPPKSEKKPGPTPTPLLAKAPAPDPQPQTFLDRKARPWKEETPDPTPEQKRLLKVQQSEQASQAIWKNIPADKANLTLDYKKQLPVETSNLTQSNQPPSYYDQWKNAAQKQIGPGDPKGVEQYFNENRKSLKTLDWLLQTNLNPALQDQNPELNITRAAGRGAYTDRTNYYKSEYQDYLTPAKDPTRERVQLTALKKGTLEQLTGKAPTNGVEIVRQIITKDEKGQPQSTFYTKSKDGWVPLSGIKPEQIIVTVNAPQADGQQPGTLGSTVNIAGAEQHTRKQYNTINQNYQTYINPTFTQYQQLRGDTPRQLSGSNLRNEIGVAMNFTPNNAPLSETDQKALQTGNWDLFSPDKISPELAQSITPHQQEKLKSQLKEQHEALTKIEGKVKEIGGDNAKVTTLPIMVDSPDIGGVMQVPLFRVAGKDGKDRFIDNTGRTYDNFQDWKDNNKLPAGRVSYFAEGQISSNKDGKPNIVTEKTHAVIDTPWEHIKQVGDWVATGVGVAVGVVAIGALILGTGGLATPLVVAGAGAALWGAGSAAGKLHDRSSHGESLSLADAEARSAWIELAANGVGFAAIGSSIRAGGAISKVMSTADEAGMLTASARQVNQASNLARTSQVLNGASSATDGVALADSTYGLAKGWDKLSAEQRLMAIGQIGFWGGMMAHGSREAMGNNFYASKDVDAFMHGVAAKPKENLTNPNLGDGVIPGQTRDEKIAQLREQTSSGRTKEELQARLIELKRQQQEGGTKVGDQKPKSEMVPTKPIDKETQPGTTPTQDKKTSTPKQQVTPEPALQQRTSNLDSLYKDATVAQAELDKVTRLVSQKVGGEPLIPPSLKGRDRTQQKIETDYGGDASRITDLARSSIICDNPQQIYKALGELKGQGHVVRVKDRFEKPVNGYRDMLVNVEMSNGHIVEVQLHLRSVMEVKNGVGHKLYEQVRTIEAQAKQEGRALTPGEAKQVRDLNGQMKAAYDEAFEKATMTGVEKSGEIKNGGIAAKDTAPKVKNPKAEVETTTQEAKVNEPQDIELHNHFGGVLQPNELLRVAGYDKNPAGALESLWSEAKTNPNSSMKGRLESVGLIDATGNWLGSSDPRVAKQLINEFLSSTSGLPHGEVYRLRNHFASQTDPKVLAEAIVMDLKKQGIQYAELQGKVPEGLSYPEFRQILDEHGIEVRFLQKVKTNRFTSGDSEKEIAKKIKNDTFLSKENDQLNAVGQNGVVGLDVAGPEKGEFTSAGMKRFELMYELLAGKAENLDGALVFRIHAGEGDPIRDMSGNFASGSNHRDIAQNNVGHLLNSIEGMSEKGVLSDKVIIRIGHATHASPEQLDRIRILEGKGVKIYVEANLTSNLTTGSVNDAKEQREVLLRFLKHGVIPTLNTDGGGVMGTTLRQEKTLAQNIITGFKSNQLEITEGNTKYYYSDLPSLVNRDPKFEYKLLPEESRRNFEIDKIEKGTEDYRKEVIPKLHGD